jgi:ribosomal protein L44E
MINMDKRISRYCPYCGTYQIFKYSKEEYEKLDLLKLECCNPNCSRIFITGKKENE